MTTLDDLLTLEEAAQLVAEWRMLWRIEHDDLHVCCSITAPLSGVTIHCPDGSSEQAGRPLDFKGIVKSLVQPKDDGSLELSLCEVITSASVRFSHRDGRLTRGFRLPTEDGSGRGRIAPGYRVTGFADFIVIPRADWRVLRQDLLPDAAQTASTETRPDHINRSPGQDMCSTVSSRASKCEPWVVRAREYANDIWLRQLNANKRVSKREIAEEIARRLYRDDKMQTKLGKRISGDYVLRHALSQDSNGGWKPPEPE